MSQALYAPDGLYLRLVEVARARGVSAEELLRAILAEGIERENAITAQSTEAQEPLEEELGEDNSGVDSKASCSRC